MLSQGIARFMLVGAHGCVPWFFYRQAEPSAPTMNMVENPFIVQRQTRTNRIQPVAGPYVVAGFVVVGHIAVCPGVFYTDRRTAVLPYDEIFR